MRLTAGILGLLSALLFLNVALPQASSSPGEYALLVRSGAGWRFALETLGLGSLATSPIFVAALAAFFVQLVAVLVDRAGATLRRARFQPPTPAQASALLAADPGAVGGVDEARALEVLAAFGYRHARVEPLTVWGIKHRLAVLGFPLFHASFLLLCAGGVLLYLTRDVVTLAASEGQPVDTADAAVIRRAPLGPPPPAGLSVELVEVALEGGHLVGLGAAVRLAGPAGGLQRARINHPARWGDLTLLVEKAGVAPVVWLQDERGFTRDRIAVPTSAQGGLPTRLKPGEGTLELEVEPIALGAAFPERDALGAVPIALRVLDAGRELFAGTLRPGEGVAIPGGTLRIQEVRYWVGMRLVSERGGGLLVAGFLLLVTGVAWRLLSFRREVVVSWSGGRLRVGGRAELFPVRFAAELSALREHLLGDGVDAAARRARSVE